MNKAALRREKKTKTRLLIDGFDELNVFQQVESLYSDLDTMFRKKIKELWRARFIEVYYGVKKKEPKEDIIDELFEMHLAGLLDEPNEVTHYTYSSEILRKRDRAIEAIISTPTKTQKQLALDKQLRFVLQMDAWYIDLTSQDAEISAYKEVGVKRVQRHEQDDDRVCSVCSAADGAIYDMDKIPPLDHLGCRAWYTPYKG